MIPCYCRLGICGISFFGTRLNLNYKCGFDNVQFTSTKTMNVTLYKYRSSKYCLQKYIYELLNTKEAAENMKAKVRMRRSRRKGE